MKQNYLLLSPSAGGAEILLNLFAPYEITINYHRSLFRHYANAMTHHRYATKAHSILTNKKQVPTLNTLCTAPWRLSLVKI